MSRMLGILWTGDIGPGPYWALLLGCVALWGLSLLAPIVTLLVVLFRSGRTAWLRVLDRCWFPAVLGLLFTLLASFAAAHYATEHDWFPLELPLAAPMAACVVAGPFCFWIVFRARRVRQPAA